VLIDAQQRPYAFTGFRDESPEAYVSHLDELQAARVTRDDALAAAATASGLERAMLLDEALSAMDPIIVEVYYRELLEEIGQLDADDEAGLRTKYFAQRDREMRQAIMSNIAMVSRLRKPEEAIAFIDTTVAENKLPLELWLVAQQTKLRLLRSLNNADEANALSDQLINTPDVDPQFRQRLVNNKAFYLASLNRPDEAFRELAQQIKSQPDNLLMTIAVGDLHDSLGQYDEALVAYDQAIVASAARPETLLEVVQAKADVLFEIKRPDDAMATLDKLIDDAAIPGHARAEALLHKALLLRETGRRRAAILAENKAVEMVETVEEKAEIQKLIDQFRRKFDSTNTDDGGSDESPADGN
jgi:tetratricopeptide (TPR) repeat protein